MRFLIVFLVSVSLVGVLILHNGAPTKAHNVAVDENDGNLEAKQVRSHLPKLFDFGYYKSVFKKRYGSFREELVRQKIVLAKAFRAFISGISYKFKRSKFYLALNQNSDRTPEEKKASIPKIRPFRSLNSTEIAKIDTAQLPVSKPEMLDRETVEEELEKIKQDAKDADNDMLVQVIDELDGQANKRSKRSLDDPQIRSDFSLNNLLKDPSLKAKLKLDYDTIESNNPNYQPPEISSMESAEGQTEAPMSEEDIDDLSKQESSVSDATNKMVIKLAKPRKIVKEKKSNDVRYADFSKSECMPEVSYQGLCGSCYAFTMTAMYSWLMCEHTGKLVHFSEQYIVDCGPETEYKISVNGCDGGLPEYGGQFFEKYGLEMARNYPYMAKPGKCPYEDVKENSEQMGYLRLNKGAGEGVFIGFSKFEKQLNHSPLIIGMGTGGSFEDYGGGIWDDKTCCREEGDACGEHAVVLVGHGREDGEDYWIIRNSHGAWYGENGYIRMNKKNDCIWPKYGVVYAYREKIGSIYITPRKNRRRSKDAQERILDKSRYPEDGEKKSEEKSTDESDS